MTTPTPNNHHVFANNTKTISEGKKEMGIQPHFYFDVPMSNNTMGIPTTIVDHHLELKREPSLSPTSRQANTFVKVQKPASNSIPNNYQTTISKNNNNNTKNNNGRMRKGCLVPKDNVIVESLSKSGDSHQWLLHWHDVSYKTIWALTPPKFKNCKRKFGEFDDSFSNTWYKAPYKYHMLVDMDGVKPADNIMVKMNLIFENGDELKGKEVNNNQGMVSLAHYNDNTPTMQDRFQATIGPFQFNVCSYKEDGRRFRMKVAIIDDNTNTLVAELISSPFVIRAKKPVGQRKRKRKASQVPQQLEEEENGAASKKKRLGLTTSLDLNTAMRKTMDPQSILTYFGGLEDGTKLNFMLELINTLNVSDRTYIMSFLQEGMARHAKRSFPATGSMPMTNNNVNMNSHALHHVAHTPIQNATIQSSYTPSMDSHQMSMSDLTMIGDDFMDDLGII